MTFSQDGNQRTNSQWTYYLYDGLDRLTEQGVCPDKSLTSRTVHIVNHYDGYDFVGTGMFAAPEFEAGSVSGKGLLTGSVAYGLNVAGPVRTVFHYDNKGRVVKETASNGLNGFDTRVTTYSFTDKPLTVTHTHTASGKEGLTEVYTYTYDHADRLSSVKHRLNDGTEVVLANYTYDDLGRIQAKKLHNSTHTTSYAYNVRGWTTGITNGNFTQSLTYNNGTAGFNGNITAMTWTAGGSSHNYAFTYDGLNRMLNATHDTNAYTEKVTGYDKNGNITGLQRYGNGLIDNLTYTYNGNRLTKVEDATGNATGFTDGASQANEYSYDNNGNLTQDLNKGITNISYNYLNLPQQIRYSNGVVVNYGYSADGVKQRVQHLNSGLPSVVYCGNVIYEGDVAKLLLTEEGYIDLANGNAYYYYLKDHQGNNRVALSSSGTVMETNHYYPFGGVFSTSTNVQPYKYNGKELDTMNGLNRYDYGARHYDAALGRWHVVDPLAEKYYFTSSYAYCLNNPVVLVDEEGKAPVKALKAFFNVGRKAYKTYKKTGKADIIQAIKQEGLDFADNVKTLFDSESSTFEKVIAGVDLVTGFGDEASKGAKILGIADNISDKAKDAAKILTDLNITDGMKLTSNEALELGEKILGKGYKETVEGSGRFISADGTRVFRMGKNDIEGRHGGGSHVNIEILEPNPDKQGKMRVVKNIHIFIED